MRRTFTYLLAASIALSGSTIGVTGASAAAPRLSAPAAVETGAPIEQVDRRGGKYKKWKKYSRSRHHDRHYSKRHRHNSHRYYSSRRHHHHNNGLPLAAGIIGFALGTAVVGTHSPRYYRGGSNDRYCARKYRSWDPHSKTYLGYDGRRHYCRIP